MASRFPSESKVQLKARKGHDMNWSCDIHAEPIAFYCKKHKIPICHRCATKDHSQKPCELQDIEDVIFETRRKLDDTPIKIAAAKKSMKMAASKIEHNATSASNHLQSVNNEVNAIYDGKLVSFKDKERDDILLINVEADEEIRIINEKRERRIKVRTEKTQMQHQICKDNQAKLLSEVKKINTTVRQKIEDLKRKNQHEMNTMDNMNSKIERIKQDDKTLVNEGPQLIAILDESLSSNVHQEVADYLDRIQREVQRVKFVEGEVGGEHYGRIDGYIDKWELVKSIDIPLPIKKPRVRGLISDDKICLSGKSRKAVYVTNISTEHTEKVIEGNSKMSVTSCAPVDSNIIVCGKWRGYVMLGDTLHGGITLYDRQWKVIRDITIPKNVPLFNTVYVDVDRDGMILAAQETESNIYVINPADGKIVNTITMKIKEVWGGIHALSSGDIVVKTDLSVFTVITRSGEEKAVTRCDEWGVEAWCYVDKLTDTLYITYRDRKRDVEAVSVDQVSSDGNIQARRIVEYKQSDVLRDLSPCLVTPSGNLVACDRAKLFLYKKSSIV